MMQDQASHDPEASRRPDVYTHGHHDSVLRSHRWRTAENSAAYLLPHLRRRDAAARRRLRPRHHHRRPRRRGRARAGRSGSTGPSGRSAEARAHAAPTADVEFAHRRRLRARRPGRRFDVVHAHQVLQHLDRPGRGPARDAPRLPARRARRGPRRRLRRHHLVARAARAGPWLELYRAVRPPNGGEPDAGRRLLAWAHAAGFADVTASASVWCFATPADRAWWSSSWATRATSSDFAAPGRRARAGHRAATRRHRDRLDELG